MQIKNIRHSLLLKAIILIYQILLPLGLYITLNQGNHAGTWVITILFLVDMIVMVVKT